MEVRCVHGDMHKYPIVPLRINTRAKRSKGCSISERRRRIGIERCALKTFSGSLWAGLVVSELYSVVTRGRATPALGRRRWQGLLVRPRRLQRLATVLKPLEQVGLTANLKKCAVGQMEVQYLGYHSEDVLRRRKQQPVSQDQKRGEAVLGDSYHCRFNRSINHAKLVHGAVPGSICAGKEGGTPASHT